MIKLAEIVDRKEVFVEAHIADIHFGVMDPMIQYNILKEQFLNYIYSMQTLDIVSINGDLFDHKFIASAEAIMVANQFINDLVNICKMKNATLILISGTSYHDSNQLNLFRYLETSNDVDVRIVNEAKFLYIKGKKILCIPELYNKGSSYYYDFLYYNGYYDACYMHGTYKGAIYGKNVPNLDSNREPVFDIKDFSFCLGPIISGHKHIRSIHDNDFYYCGSPIRWCFGEEQEKGFLILLHDLTTRHYLVHFEPITSFRYDTIELSDIINNDPNTIINYINEIKSRGIYKLRVVFTINDRDKIAILKSYYKANKNVTLVVDEEKQAVEEKINEMEDEYNKFLYLFDRNLSPEEKLTQYMNQVHGTTFWDVDVLNKLLAI